MAYIGNPPANRFVAPKAASVHSGNGILTDFTLDHSVGSDEDILVSVDGVIQEPSVAYTVSGTTLSFTAAPSNNSGNNIFVYYLFRTVGTVSHPSNNALTATSGTFTGNIVIPDAGNIGSASDTDAISISSGGVVNFTQTPTGVSTITTLNSGGVSLSGTNEAQFTSLPSGIKRITVMFNQISSGSSDTGLLVRLGTSSGFVTSGYTQASFQVKTSDNTSGVFQDTTGFGVRGIDSSNTVSGIMTIAHQGGNNFVESHVCRMNSTQGVFGGGKLALGGTLTQVRVSSSSGSNFDDGTVNIFYEL
jgi:hypothetical protein